MRFRPALRTAAVAAGVGLASLSLTGAAPAASPVPSRALTGASAPQLLPATFTPQAGMPGKLNALTDVPGIEVGQVHQRRSPFLTGTTIVHFPTMAVASVDQRGGAPATKETDLLSPLNSNPGVNAIQLGGSSMYGLAATNGAIRWLEDRKEGGRPCVTDCLAYGSAGSSVGNRKCAAGDANNGPW